MRARIEKSTSWIVAAVLGLLAVMAFSLPALHAQEAEGDVVDEPAEATPVVDTWTPFAPPAVDPGAILYDQLLVGPRPAVSWPEGDEGLPEETAAVLSAETRASVDDVQAFAEQNGYVVHQAWAGYSAAMAAQAELARAEYEAGLAGFGDVGVLP